MIKIFLAGVYPVKENWKYAKWGEVNILESFFACRKNNFIHELLKHIVPENFLLDSGAFTFMMNISGAKKIDWDLYIKEYADFILMYKIKLFFELDIDVIVGLSEVERLRNKLEKLVGRQCIPVWHKSRGKQYWLDMVRDYKYIAIGGVVAKEIKKNEMIFLPWFIDQAHKNNVKVHGLGIVNEKIMKMFRFDSVDSTAWIYGNKMGFVFYFNGQGLVKKYIVGDKRIDALTVATHNFNEWVKFARYMENR
jgi:hypothetical protein